jgi:hypothetical protein
MMNYCEQEIITLDYNDEDNIKTKEYIKHILKSNKGIIIIIQSREIGIIVASEGSFDTHPARVFGCEGIGETERMQLWDNKKLWNNKMSRDKNG